MFFPGICSSLRFGGSDELSALGHEVSSRAAIWGSNFAQVFFLILARFLPDFHVGFTCVEHTPGY